MSTGSAPRPGISYFISMLTLAMFYYFVRVRNWPTNSGPFNVWINLPTFDPTTGGDVVQRLERDARFNIVLGFLLPFLIPAVLKAVGIRLRTGHAGQPAVDDLDRGGMGISTGKPVDARTGPGPDRRTDRAQAQQHRARGKGLAAGLILFVFSTFSARGRHAAHRHLACRTGSARGRVCCCAISCEGEDAGITRLSAL